MASNDTKTSGNKRDFCTRKINEGLWGTTPLQNFILGSDNIQNIAVSVNGSGILSIKNNNKFDNPKIMGNFPNGNGPYNLSGLWFGERLSESLLLPTYYITFKTGKAPTGAPSYTNATYSGTKTGDVWTVTAEADYALNSLISGSEHLIQFGYNGTIALADIEKIEVAQKIYTDSTLGGKTQIYPDVDGIPETPGLPITGDEDIHFAEVTGINGSYQYTGSAITPDPTIKFNGKTLVKNTDYTVSYRNNTNLGTAEVIIDGIGDYNGQIFRGFNIVTDEVIPPTPTGLRGDYDQSGSVTSADVVAGKKILLGSLAAIADLNITDFDYDGKFGGSDIVALKKYFLTK
jgi:hypothetical protein